jgi:hypothetical protein
MGETYEIKGFDVDTYWEDLGTCPTCGGEFGSVGHPANEMPVPFIEISQYQFQYLFHTSDTGLRGTNYRQVRLPDEEGVKGVHFYLWHDKCLAVASISVGLLDGFGAERKRRELETAKGTVVFDERPGRSKWHHRLRFFRVGCSHGNLKEVGHKFAQEELGIRTWGMFCHAYHCPDCGYHRAVDSSG